MAGISGVWQSAPMQQWAEMEEAIQREQNKDLLTSWGWKEAVICKQELFLGDISACVQLFTGSDGVSMTHQWAGLALYTSLETSSLLLPNEVFWIKDKKLQPQSLRSLEMVMGTQQAREEEKKKKAESWILILVSFSFSSAGEMLLQAEEPSSCRYCRKDTGPKGNHKKQKRDWGTTPPYSAVSDCIHISQAQFK